MPPAGNANFAWLQHMIYHLAPAGRIGMVLAMVLSLRSPVEKEKSVRISLKMIWSNVLSQCQHSFSIQHRFRYLCGFLNKQKKQTGKTLFIDARKMGTMVSRKLRELTDDDIGKIADTYTAFVDGTLEDVKGFCAVADLDEIEKQELYR